MLLPSSSQWASGDIVWDVDQAQKWQFRMMNAKGAWIWSVKLGIGRDISMIDVDDVEFLKSVYIGLHC